MARGISPPLAFLVATSGQFAINGANYYESVNAAQNLLGGWLRWSRAYSCLVIAGGGALAARIVNYKIMNAWYKVPIFLAITAPCATTIMAIDRFVLPRWFPRRPGHHSLVAAGRHGELASDHLAAGRLRLWRHSKRHPARQPGFRSSKESGASPTGIMASRRRPVHRVHRSRVPQPERRSRARFPWRTGREAERKLNGASSLSFPFSWRAAAALAR